MSKNDVAVRLGLPKHWQRSVQSALLHVISLARMAITASRGWVADGGNARVRLRAENCRLREELSLAHEEIRIKDVRMAQIPPQRRPHYPPVERMAILEYRAARGWSLRQTADAFHMTPATIRSWMRRLDEDGPDALVLTRVPINRFPDFVRYAVQRLKVLCPTMGKQRIADALSRAGLHLGTTTVARFLKEAPQPKPIKKATTQTVRTVTAKRPNHVWHVDLTIVPIRGGFWTAWLPFSLPQRWPFCWWVAVVIDHYSRRAMGSAVYPSPPNSIDVRAFLGRTISRTKETPQYLICDKGSQFWCDGFRHWSRRRGIGLRFGAVGKHGSIAIVERFIRTMKQEGTRQLLVPHSRQIFGREIQTFFDWYNVYRPHTALQGCTPDEVYHRRRPANRMPRFETRVQWPRPAPCAAPKTLVKGQLGVRLVLDVRGHAGRKHLPIVSLRHAA
jgi:putative transposase